MAFLSEIDVSRIPQEVRCRQKNNLHALQKTHRRTRYLATFHFITATLMAWVLSFWYGMAWMIRLPGRK